VVNSAASAAPLSRRAMLRTSGAGLVVGATVLAAGCGASQPGKPKHKLSEEQRRANVEILNGALDLEHKAIAAYTAGTPLLSPSAQKIAQQFLSHELAHADELSGLIIRQHGTPEKARPSYDLGHPRSADQVLALLHDIEQAQIRAYLAAIPEVAPGTIRSALAAILGSDAQHIALLRLNLGQPAFAGPLVTGNE
jgi:bacterioferritin (cytochrome b1)